MYTSPTAATAGPTIPLKDETMILDATTVLEIFFKKLGCDIFIDNVYALQLLANTRTAITAIIMLNFKEAIIEIGEDLNQQY